MHQIHIYNNLGQLVLQTSFQEQIDETHLPQGTYQLQLYHEQSPIAQKKIIISK